MLLIYQEILHVLLMEGIYAKKKNLGLFKEMYN